MSRRVAIIGGGIAGISCAAALTAAGIPVRIFDRGHRLGGRLAAQTLRGTGTPHDGRPVDVGAAYFTARDPQFSKVVDGWRERGIVRPWTDTFHIADPRGVIGPKLGPMRYATPGGLRSVVEDLAGMLPEDLVDVRHPVDVPAIRREEDVINVCGDGYAAVAICVPDPQAAAVLTDPSVADARALLDDGPVWEPVMSLTAVFDDVCWDAFDGVFVNNDAVVTFIADDGRRRGDDAPVLVAHSTATVAAAHLAEPLGAAPAMLAGLSSVLRPTGDPAWFSVKRWTYARPLTARDRQFGLVDGIGLAGDAWAGGPRIESAWLSGQALGSRLAQSLVR
jgi:renalase